MRQPKLLDREPSQAGCPVLQEPALQSGRLGPSQREFKPLVVRDSANPRASPGGTPEPYDSGLVATLVREAFEENQVRVDEAAYLGYQEVRRPGRAPYAQVRMAGLIWAFEARLPDPDGGRT
ncbi:MAG TPA: NUDIX hydrolase, partial [Streptosporangiaceae bacterium]